jgi:hypothetical protein
VTIQGETLVQKFLPRKGPSGAISQNWWSRADQSLSRHMPKTWSSACGQRHRLAQRIAVADVEAHLQLVVQPRAGAVNGAFAPGGMAWPVRAVERRCR